MKTNRNIIDSRSGFTTIDLMTAAAIVGILSGIAVPNFVDMQYRAKRAEVPSNLSGIKVSEIAFEAHYDEYMVLSDYHPDATPGKKQRRWSGGSAFDTLGWAPDGDVRGSYKVMSLSGTDFRITGICDVNGNGSQTTYTATTSINPVLAIGSGGVDITDSSGGGCQVVAGSPRSGLDVLLSVFIGLLVIQRKQKSENIALRYKFRSIK